jgi:energy-coupling factor transport system permease protein
VTPILAGPGWRLALVSLLVGITLVSGLPARLWQRSLALWLALSLAVGMLSAFLPADSIPPASLQRPPTELRLTPAPAGAPPAVRAGRSWELLRIGPLRLGPASLGPLVITRRSALLGLRSGTLLFTLIHSANLLLLTTAPEALVWAMAWFLRPFAALGLPVERLGFTLLLSLRFLPLVQEELQNLLRSIATRAVSLRQLGWRAGLALVLAVGERLLANVLLRSEQGAEALLARGARLTELLKQPQFKPVPVEEQVLAIFAGTRGYLDGIPVNSVGEFERRMLSEIKASAPEIVDAIRNDREIKKPTEDKLVAFLDGFAKSFAA